VVKGLDVFRDYFAGHADQFVLIGGTAATLAMEDAGLAFRATKDLDIVLHIEALTPEFGVTFWSFVEQGGYDVRQASATGKPVFYRFQKPADAHFPAMLELFCRSPDGIQLAAGSHLTPIPLDEAVASPRVSRISSNGAPHAMRSSTRRWLSSRAARRRALATFLDVVVLSKLISGGQQPGLLGSRNYPGTVDGV
jgi:hypothetical protein